MKFFLLLIAFLFSSTFFLTPELGVPYDAPRYISLAYSIAIGNGYKFIYDSENRPCFYNNFLFPYLLSLPIRIWGINLLILKGFILILSSLCLLIFYRWAKFYLKEREAFYLSILFLSSSLFLEFCDKVLSEIPFLFFLLLSFCSFESWRRNKQSPSLISLFSSLYLATFTRLAGIAMIISLGFFGWIKKHPKLILSSLLLLLLVTVSIIFIQQNVLAQDRFYHLNYLLYRNPFEPEAGTLNLKEIGKRFSHNLNFYLLKIGNHTLNFPSKPAWVSILSLLFILIGILKARFNSSGTYYSSFLLFYLLQYLIWPWQDSRFLMPVSFLFLYYFYYGIKHLLRNAPSPLKLLVYSLLLGLSIYGGLYKVILKARFEPLASPAYQEFVQLAKWAQRNLESNSVILSSQPALFYLFSFRKGAFLIYSSDLDKISAYIQRKGVTHILADRFNLEMRKYIYPWIIKNAERLKLLKVSGRSLLLELN